MHAEIDGLATSAPVAILGVNGAGQESANAAACAGRVLPWLQDDGTSDVWGLWGVAYRDVVVLDPSNRVVAIYNLTAHDLADPANYEALKTLILDAAN